MSDKNNYLSMPETVLGCLQHIISLLRKKVYGTETTTRVKRFGQDQVLDLKKEGANLGVRGFTLRNLGAHIIFISTSAVEEKEPIYPGESFGINNESRVCDQQIKIEFDPNVYANNTTPFTGKQAIVRFLVDKC
ncbi:hypothetical protein [Algibacter sp. PT7-4]|uniref:hypothetical protein n=1 Tax=Algibacter ulvanivorans TaxID=3400999 RepID=UPI003AAFCC47